MVVLLLGLWLLLGCDNFTLASTTVLNCQSGPLCWDGKSKSTSCMYLDFYLYFQKENVLRFSFTVLCVALVELIEVGS